MSVDDLLKHDDGDFEAYWDEHVVDGTCIFLCQCHDMIAYAGPITQSPKPIGVNVILSERDYALLEAKTASKQ